ncbi:MAG: hypothetical protein GXP61_06960, partial [Epsilonproteobacteria bacterium]|nr:hypothetical protein [Campylobacterota bacterium]
MNEIKIIFIALFILFGTFAKASTIDFIESYPSILYIQNNIVYFKDGQKLKYSDKKAKSFEEKLKNPSIKDMISQKYPYLKKIKSPAYNFDPGRY